MRAPLKTALTLVIALVLAGLGVTALGPPTFGGSSSVENGRSTGVDCNGNGVPDDLDIASGTSEDCDGNGVPDECDTEPTFSPVVVTTSLAGPWSVEVADLDGDGLLDILIGSLFDDTVAWSRNLGDGVFAPPMALDLVADGVRSVFAADLDGDEDLDVLSASSLGGRIDRYENLDGLGHFGPAQLVYETNQPWSVHAADLDGDTDNDVVLAAVYDDRVEWLENLGGGVFGPGQVLSVDPDSPIQGEAGPVIDPHAVSVADVDGDGDGDIVTASAGDGQIAWFANDGTGAFGDRNSVTFAATLAEAVAAADLDGDGDSDLLSASPGKVAWYPNFDGAGSFGPERVLSATAGGASSVAALDFDGDGDADVVSAAPDDHTIAWYENLGGAGNFGPRQIISDQAEGARSVFAADLDVDGDLDVLSASELDNTIAWYEFRQGVGDFGPRQLISASADGAWSVFAADLDGDGDPDVLSASQLDDTVAWYETSGDRLGDACDNCPQTANNDQADSDSDGLGDACDLCPLDALNDIDSDGVCEDVDNCPAVANPDQLDSDSDGPGDACDLCPFDASNDADSDGACEDTDNCPGLANPDQADRDGDGAGDACDVCPLDAADDADSDGLCADVDNCPDEANPMQADEDSDGLGDPCDSCPADPSDDGDGDGFCADEDNCPDVANAAQADGDIDGVGDVCDNCPATANADQLNSDGGFGPPQVVNPLADGAVSVFAADLDSDGDVDILSASSNDDTIAWYENEDGAGGFGPEQMISTAADGARSVFAADVDGDGDIDVLSASFNDDTIAWNENLDGAGSFGSDQLISNTAYGAQSVFAADVDSDGDVDVLSAWFDDDRIAWYENEDGAGSFGARLTISTAADGAFSVFAADVDGDGDLDALSASAFDGEVAWYENLDGMGSFGSQQVISDLAAGARSVFAADVDGDGDVDVLSASASDDTIAWYENEDGAGGFGARRTISIATDGAFSVFATDVDGDGDTDVLSASVSDDTIAWHENLDGAGDSWSRRVISSAADSARSVFAADVNGDGGVDVLSASSSDDKVAWYANGDSLGDACDNCPDESNPGQEDADSDGIGDACDAP